MMFTINPSSPTGRFAVGVTTYRLVDSTRRERFADDLTQKRELALQIWYPSTPATDAKALSGTSAFPWGSLICPPRSMKESEYSQFFDHIAHLIQVTAEQLGWPKRTGLIRSHAFPHEPLRKADSPYPIILFSHGNGGYIAQTSYLMEELASHGYVGIAIGHTYNGWLTIFPDGRIIPVNFDHPIYKTINEESAQAQSVIDEIRKSDSWSYQQQRFRELYEEGEFKKLMPTYFEMLQERCADLQLTIDELHRLENDPAWPFAGVLDLDRIGVLGYSLGGETVSQLCVTEQRVKVGVALDSELWGSMLGQSIKQPFFCMYAEDGLRNIDYDTGTPSIIIDGTKHASFGANSHWWEAEGREDVKGSLATARCHEIVRRYTLAFFNYHFHKIPDALLKGETVIIPEVSYLVSPLV